MTKTKLFAVSGLVTFIVLAVVLFNIGSALIPEVNTAGSQLNESNLCQTDSLCIYNSSSSATAPCRLESNQTLACTSGANPSVPLSGLFNNNGVIVLLVVASLFFLIYVGAKKGLRK